jgi:WD40 repeat protein
MASEYDILAGHPYHTEGLTCLNISSDSTLVVSGSTEGSVHVVNIKNGKVSCFTFCEPGEVNLHLSYINVNDAVL